MSFQLQADRREQQRERNRKRDDERAAHIPQKQKQNDRQPE